MLCLRNAAQRRMVNLVYGRRHLPGEGGSTVLVCMYVHTWMYCTIHPYTTEYTIRSTRHRVEGVSMRTLSPPGKMKMTELTTTTVPPVVDEQKRLHTGKKLPDLIYFSANEVSA